MATGYTKALEDTGYNVSRWLKQHVIRAMGVAVMLRDEPMDLSEEEVGKRITGSCQEDIDRAKKNLEKAKQSFEKLVKRPDSEWGTLYEKQRDEAEADLSKRLDIWHRDKKEHEQALKECKRLLEIATKKFPKDSVQVGTLKFAVEQLEQTIEWDFKSLPYSDSILTTPLKKWKQQSIEGAEEGIQYASDNLKKTLERESNRGKGYLDFVRFVNENLEKKS